jgi:hypothetical protein
VYEADNSCMNQELGPLLVEIFLERAHILGVCRQVQERRRLIDVLNSQDEILEIEQARVSLGSSTEPKHYETLSIMKSFVLAAVPRETQEQNRRRAVLTNMMGKQETRQKQISLIVPPLALVGSAHISAGSGGALSVKTFSKFFPLTGATLSISGQADRELDVALVSRDHIVAMSLIGAPRMAQAV